MFAKDYYLPINATFVKTRSIFCVKLLEVVRRQQDGALSHRLTHKIAFLQTNVPDFYRASAVAASPVLATIGMSVRLSVRPSVRPSHADIV